MTGYAAGAADTPRGALALEIRTVNGRFLDLQLRVADELRALEPMLRDMLVARLARGKVDCRLALGAPAAGAPARTLNAAALAQLRRLVDEARRAFPEAAPLALADVLRWPGVLAEAPLDEAAVREAVQALAARVLDDLCAARAREGARLAASLRERLAAMRAVLARAAPLVPEARAALRARLAERLREAAASTDEARLQAELALLAARSDVDEELTRLRAHLDEIEQALAEGGAVGKRLDFLAQEMNREANTLAAKAAGLALAQSALELRLLVEQVREQVQNIE
ncbi:MAG: YicC/YloC family endoribonuclease [Burkholderiales bacterium]|nr:YicC/YloC family endoribonuclease [Burkholderiales bacterium]